MASERVEGQTPAGGAYAVATWFDDDWNEVEKDAATKCAVREFDAAGVMLAETFADVGPPGQPQPQP